MLDRLPPELLEHICRKFELEDGPKALAALQVTCKTTRSIATMSILWQPFFDARWTRCIRKEDARRRRRYASNYYKMYSERARLDRAADESLDELIADRSTRPARAIQFADDLGRDVWDYLQSQVKRDAGSQLTGSDTYTRRYWAAQALGVAARKEAIVRALAGNRPYSQLSLEAAVTDLSAFWGEDVEELQAKYDRLASQCKEWLVSEKIALPGDADKFDRVQFCRSLCTWMRGQGFGPAPEGQYTRLMNHFAHTFLTTHRRTLPMSLIIVFLALSSRLGLPASPVAFPMQVIVRVHTRADRALADDDIFVDVFSETRAIISRAEIQDRLSQLDYAVVDHPTVLRPTSTHDMLQRVTNNIWNSLSTAVSSQQSQQDYSTAGYLTLCVSALVATPQMQHARFLDHLVDARREQFPLDLRPIVQRGVAKALSPDARRKLELLCEARIQEDARDVKLQVRTERILYAVGQIVFHRRYHYWGVIRSWDHSCTGTESWINLMDVDRLPGGRQQPFYRVFSLLDDTSPERYVASCNIIPLHTCPSNDECPTCQRTMILRPPPLWSLVDGVLRSNPSLGRYFTHVEEGWMGRARFVPSPELCEIYPEDDTFAHRAIQQPAASVDDVPLD
ncbi:hypothetical protein AURDEDRAFT_158772 [Auricularia subglabra TFB-10046 SS5]|nr:hypothetical protein AURDEDRAFT_158772 [Auricularia subglabra TFB-10046 SS5]